jgi:DNA-binding LytR/AlgR family response regulator
MSNLTSWFLSKRRISKSTIKQFLYSCKKFCPIFVLMNIIAATLNKPYPLEERKTAQLKLAFIFGTIVFLLLFLFNPFGAKKDILLNAIYAGVLTFIAIVFNFFVLFPLFPQFFKEEKWTIGREIIFTIIIIITIGSFNIIAGQIFWGITLSVFNWLRMIFYTAIIGIAPATFSILINQARLLKKYRQQAKQINVGLHQPAEIVQNATVLTSPLNIIAEEKPVTKLPTAVITIETENEKDNLIIPAAHFLAAVSADNYVKIFYIEAEKLKIVMLRATLKKVGLNTASFPAFFRCHRTAIVNIAAVENLSGTAQGYRLHLTYLPEAIPVSRNLNQVIKEKLAAIRP